MQKYRKISHSEVLTLASRKERDFVSLYDILYITNMFKIKFIKKRQFFTIFLKFIYKRPYISFYKNVIKYYNKNKYF